MGGDRARMQAQAEQPVVQPDPKVKKSRGGFFGVSDVFSGVLGTGSSSSRRGTFLGG